MCCSPITEEEKAGECPDCGADVDNEGIAIGGCAYSPELCKTCKDCPCDLSC